MGTKFRTMLAPIGLSTGDGRRFAEGGITLADVPFALEWVRSREGGHDGAVGVGVVQAATVATVKDALAADLISPEAAKGLDPKMTAVWATGEMFDDVDRERMPTLAEDVATSMHLAAEGTLGPSVDLDSFEAVPVFEGSDDPVTWEAIEAYYEEHGEEPKLELLVTEARVRAGTLVSIPAFAETSRPFELILETEPQDEAAVQADALALVASVATATLPSIGAFALPALAGPTPITFDWETGRVFGHIALFATCHVGYADVCVTPPRDESGSYAWFNRFPVETDEGTVWAGRITVGGRHAGLALDAARTMSVYDQKTTVAHVRAYEDAHGIVISGHLELAADSPERAVLDRRKVSGDWRETPNGLSLLEVLALSPGPRAHAEPGFPVGTFSRNGRQVALTASLGPEPDQTTSSSRTAALVDVDALAAALERRQEARAARSAAKAELATIVGEQIEKERAALAAALERGGESDRVLV